MVTDKSETITEDDAQRKLALVQTALGETPCECDDNGPMGSPTHSCLKCRIEEVLHNDAAVPTPPEPETIETVAEAMYKETGSRGREALERCKELLLGWINGTRDVSALYTWKCWPRIHALLNAILFDRRFTDFTAELEAVRRECERRGILLAELTGTREPCARCGHWRSTHHLQCYGRDCTCPGWVQPPFPEVDIDGKPVGGTAAAPDRDRDRRIAALIAACERLDDCRWCGNKRVLDDRTDCPYCELAHATMRGEAAYSCVPLDVLDRWQELYAFVPWDALHPNARAAAKALSRAIADAAGGSLCTPDGRTELLSIRETFDNVHLGFTSVTTVGLVRELWANRNSIAEDLERMGDAASAELKRADAAEAELRKRRDAPATPTKDLVTKAGLFLVSVDPDGVAGSVTQIAQSDTPFVLQSSPPAAPRGLLGVVICQCGRYRLDHTSSMCVCGMPYDPHASQEPR